MPQTGQYLIRSLNDAIELYKQHPEYKNELIKNVYGFADWLNVYEARNNYDSGNIDANDLLRTYGENTNITMSPETEKWLDNTISQENATTQYNREITARDTSLLSSGSQLQQLGLSPSSVIQTGGASAGVQAAPATNATRSNSALKQQMKINKFNQIMGLSKSLIGAAGSMASSGIYGHALGAIKKSVQTIGAAAAHSAYGAMRAGMKLSDFRSSLGPSQLGMQTNPHQIPTGMNWQADWDDIMNDLGY